MPKILSDEQINFYREKGYVKVENVVPPRSIKLGRKVCADWVDRTVQGWVDEGLLADGLEQLDLAHRLTVAWNEAGKPMYPRSPRRQIVSPELFQFMSEPKVIDIAEDLPGHARSLHARRIQPAAEAARSALDAHALASGFAVLPLDRPRAYALDLDAADARHARKQLPASG